MSSRTLLRQLRPQPHVQRLPRRSLFHTTPSRLISVGDSLPSIDALREDSPGTKINLADELGPGSKGIVIGVPGAFSPGCSMKHVPDYLKHPNLKDAGKTFVVAVNDPFVTKAWSAVLDPGFTSGVRFLSDPAGEFTKALDLELDAKQIFGNMRSKRYALVIEDGKVKAAHIEPDGTGINESRADNVLGPATGVDWSA